MDKPSKISELNELLDQMNTQYSNPNFSAETFPDPIPKGSAPPDDNEDIVDMDYLLENHNNPQTAKVSSHNEQLYKGLDSSGTHVIQSDKV